MDILDVGKNGVVIDVRMRALQEVAGVEGQTQAGDELTELDGDLGVGGQGVDVGEQGQHQALAHGVAREWREPLDLVGDRRARRGGMDRDARRR